MKADRFASVVMAVVVASVVTGCLGESQEAKEAFDAFALDRQAAYPAIVTPGTPVSIQDYVIGRSGITPAGYVVSGAFTGGTLLAPTSNIQDPGESTLVGHFTLHDSLRGVVPSSFDVNLGSVPNTLDADLVVRGAGDVVLFLSFDTASNMWALADRGYALAQSDEGNLSMPLVPSELEGNYLSGVIDVGDVAAMMIAADLDPNGSLNGGITDTQQDLIDKANDLAD